MIALQGTEFLSLAKPGLRPVNGFKGGVEILD